MKESIARVLKREGYVADVVRGRQARRPSRSSSNTTGRKASSKGLRRVSTPGLRRYTGAQEIPRVRAAWASPFFHLGGHHDRHAGAQEKRRRRIACAKSGNMAE
jgi:ribosomal protein S8